MISFQKIKVKSFHKSRFVLLVVKTVKKSTNVLSKIVVGGAFLVPVLNRINIYIRVFRVKIYIGFLI